MSYEGAATLPASYGTPATIGMVTRATDQAGKMRRQVVDALGRVRRSDEPNDAGQLGGLDTPVQATSYDYDALDNLIHLTQGAQQRYFLYDSLSRLRATKQPEMSAPHTIGGSPTLNTAWSTDTRYHPDGRIDQAYDANGVRTWFTYDGLNRVKTVNHDDGTPGVTYDYDQARGYYRNNGQVTTATTSAAAATPVSHAIPTTKQEYNYDWYGAVTAHSTTIGSSVYNQSYTYGGLGNLKSQTYPSGRVVSHTYDGTGRLTGVADNLNGATQSYLSGASYYAHGGLQQETWGNGAIQSVDFNSRLQPTAINLDKSGNLLQRYEYTYAQVDIDTGAPNALNNGQLGRVDAFIGRNGTTPVKQWEQRFSYDAMGRLSRAREVRADTGQSVWQQHYTYDRYGNRYQAPAGTSNPFNEGLTWLKVEASDINQTTNRYTLPQITYNTAGQITQDTYFRNSKYTYDANGRLRSSQNPDGSALATNVTDGSGERVRSITGFATATYIHDVFGRIVAEYNSRQPSLRTENIYRGAGGLLAVRATATRQSVGGGYGVSVHWVLSDVSGSTRLTVAASGAVVSRLDYTPFGEELWAGVGTRDNLQGYGVSFSARQRYAQTTRDDATDMEHTPWRKLDTKGGRWTTPDPYLGSMSVSDPQSLNRYAYVNNDPVNFIDPSGLNLFSGFCGAGYGSCGGGSENGGSGFSGNPFGDDGFFGDDGYGGSIPEGMPDSVRSSYQSYLQGLSISLAMSGRHFGFADGFHPFESTWGTSQDLQSLIDMKTPDEVRREVKDSAFADAGTVLLRDSNCARLLGLGDRRKLSSFLGANGAHNSLRRNAEIRNIGPLAQTSGTGKSAIITLDLSFFVDGTHRMSKTSPTDPRQGRAHTILHEIAHALRRIPNDARNRKQGLKNDQTITNACSKGLASLGRD